ncbi:MAG: serine/threonine-protein kinase, partial [Planctomycetota bacterium]
MARKPDGRRPRKIPPTPGGEPEPRQRDPGSETSADTKLVNAKETTPEFFKDPLIGQTLGKCRIEKLLGEGQTAIVYRAHYEPLNRTVAVKVLQAHMTKVPAVVKVFQQEARAVAALDHENVLKIYDVGEDRGSHYIVLELLRGKNLLKIIEEAGGEGLPAADALEYTRQAAAGLAAAHRKNLVHRDIKPQNLVVEPDGTLKIVDFGLAAEAEGAFSGGMLGTPHYMSPEQCRGEHAKANSDVYALGITLFHLLVGHPPHAGKTTKEEIIAEHLKGRRLEPERVRRHLPKVLGELVRRMTRMEPATRPSSAAVLEWIGKLKPETLEGGAAGSLRAGRRGRARQS